MPKNIGEESLAELIALIKEKNEYIKSLIPSSLPANGGNSDTVDGYHIRKVTTDDGGKTGYITFVV